MRERLKLIRDDKNRENNRKSMEEEFGMVEARGKKRMEERGNEGKVKTDQRG